MTRKMYLQPNPNIKNWLVSDLPADADADADLAACMAANLPNDYYFPTRGLGLPIKQLLTSEQTKVMQDAGIDELTDAEFQVIVDAYIPPA